MNKSFEDQWKDALSDASQTPPPEIWERVEAELDRKKSGFILWVNPARAGQAWRKTAMLSGVAAAVALVLGTLFFVNLPAPERGVSKTAAPPVRVQEPAGQKPESPSLRPAATADASPAIYQAEKSPETHVFAPPAKEKQAILPAQPLLATRISEPGPVNENTVPVVYTTLDPLPYRELEVYTGLPRIQAPVEYSPAISRKAQKEKKIWMGLIAANAPFNPNFSAPGFQQQALSAVQNSSALLAFDKGHQGMNGNSFYSNSSRTDARSSFKSGQSMSFGFIFGRKLKKRLSLESGVRFTRATATHTSNVYAVNKATGETESFSHANYLSSDKGLSDVLISVNGTSHYSYHFLSVPLLLNYQLLNIGKLNMNAVGGLSNEFLLSGTVVNSKQNEHTFTAGNSNFRPVSIAGVGGIRLSYPITSVLDINLGGTYQHFITSGLQKNTDATFRPSMMGINLGLSVRQ